MLHLISKSKIKSLALIRATILSTIFLGVPQAQSWQPGSGILTVNPALTKVGIGVANPSANLEVNGPVKSTSYASILGYMTLMDRSGADAYWGTPASITHFTSTKPVYFTLDGGNGFNFGKKGALSQVAINSDGNVGIGTTTPGHRLQVAGEIAIFGAGLDGSSLEKTVIYSDNANNLLFDAPKKNNVKYNVEFNWRGGGTPGLFLQGTTGNLGVGTKIPSHKLQVAGSAKIDGELVVASIRAKEWKVEVPDYVFRDGYNLRSIKQVEEFVKTNQHLPEIPSAKELNANGMDLAEMNLNLLKKVEELTLYVIDLQKQIDNLKK